MQGRKNDAFSAGPQRRMGGDTFPGVSPHQPAGNAPRTIVTPVGPSDEAMQSPVSPRHRVFLSAVPLRGPTPPATARRRRGKTCCRTLTWVLVEQPGVLATLPGGVEDVGSNPTGDFSCVDLPARRYACASIPHPTRVGQCPAGSHKPRSTGATPVPATPVAGTRRVPSAVIPDDS